MLFSEVPFPVDKWGITSKTKREFQLAVKAAMKSPDKRDMLLETIGKLMLWAEDQIEESFPEVDVDSATNATKKGKRK